MVIDFVTAFVAQSIPKFMTAPCSTGQFEKLEFVFQNYFL